MKILRIKGLYFLLLIILLFSSCSFDKPIEKPLVVTGNSIGTFYQVLYFDSLQRDFSIEIQNELDKVMKSCNIFDSNSTLSKINSNKEFQLDTLLNEILLKSIDISNQTEGFFDVTCGAIVHLWGFGNDKGKKGLLPSKAEVDEALKTVGYEKVLIQDYQIEKKELNTIINLGGIAKGYAVDLVSAFLERNHIKSFLVEIGGEIYAKGTKPDGKDWIIGISVPDDENSFNSGLQSKLKLKNKALATSGNYRNYYTTNDKKYGHTLHPKTGYPVENELLSVTVIADDCMTADAYATALMVTGLEKGVEMISQKTGIEVFFIFLDSNGVLKTMGTPDFEKRILIK